MPPLLEGKQTLGELPENDAHDPKRTRPRPLEDGRGRLAVLVSLGGLLQPEAGAADEATRLHRASRWHGGGMAVGGGRAEFGSHPTNRRAHTFVGRRSACTGPCQRPYGGPPAIRLGRRPQHTHRNSLGCGECLRCAYAERFRKYAAELVALAPDVVLAHSSPAVAALQQETSTIPIVFIGVVDPVGAGFVASLARPGGNTTGFVALDYGLSAKWLELLKEIAPRVTRVAVLRDPSSHVGIGQFAAMQAVAPSLGVELTPIDERDPGEIERGLKEFARIANGGLVVTASVSQGLYRKLIISLAARHRLPAVHPFRHMVVDGGLISYGTDLVDQYKRAADYVDRILKGEKPGELPVQAPVKYQLVVNLKTASALGLTVPPGLIARADEVIE